MTYMVTVHSVHSNLVYIIIYHNYRECKEIRFIYF